LRYQDRTRVVPIGSLRQGAEAVIEAEVLLTDIKYGRRRMLLSKISDGTGYLTLRFFHFNASQQQGLAPGARIRCFGEVRYAGQGLEMVHPEYQLLNNSDADTYSSDENYLTAIYPATEGFRQFSLRALVDQVVLDSNTLALDIPEWLPDSCLQRLKFPSITEAIAYVHKPPPDAAVNVLINGKHSCQQRLAFEELLAHHLSMRRLRLKYQQHHSAELCLKSKLSHQLQSQLAFSLTAAQQRVYSEIKQDISSSQPMLRLVQGDVGSGKTVVAALTALHAVESGYQAAIMAPTELLAYQHFKNFEQWMLPLGISIDWLSGKLKGKARDGVLEKLSSGAAQITVGTHALFQEGVIFNKLGLVIVDEQHRFGVHQRMALRNKGKQSIESKEMYPHQLIMTATPIPRTLAMTAYADLDCSVIDELPPGRTPVQTVVIEDNRRSEVIERVYRSCLAARQAYWVCTLIEESEALQCQAAEDTVHQLRQELPDLRIELVHGRMKPLEKEQVMQNFKNGSIDLLVATTVIEVGVDVPNATLMIIENAERLGLSQLHQLRGRVGRGDQQSACVLLYHPPLSQLARQRLTVMRETNDGFVIAQRDLEIRGPGELLGTRQTGMEQFHIAELQRDEGLLPEVIKTANELFSNNPVVVDAIIQRWLGRNEEYGNV
jgi:ATP-dependent DNA helicase RecG